MSETDREVSSLPSGFMFDHGATNVLIVTGMSGAGRSTAANVLEDLGYRVIDNLPPALMADAQALADLAAGERPLALVADLRGGKDTDDLLEPISGVREQGVGAAVLFLDADDDVLLRRYEENRRPHPLRRATLEESIAVERDLLVEVRAISDTIIDTTELSVHDLRARVEQEFATGSPADGMRVSIRSFGFKHGAPRDVDVMFDVRFLPNPHWEPDLRPLTGRDGPVKDYVLGQVDADAFLEKTTELLEFLIPRFRQEGKSYVAIGVGCTGGRHRSVAISEELANRLVGTDTNVVVRHRDIER